MLDVSELKRFFTRLVLFASIAIWPPVSTAQASPPASCTFMTVFPLTVNLPTIGAVRLLPVGAPAGINDFDTVVGAAADQVSSNIGFIRWKGGGLTFLPSMRTLLDRDDKGITIGYDQAGNTVLLSGTTVTPVTINLGGSSVKFDFMRGINNWGSIVGAYNGSSPNGNSPAGVKRWANGGAFTFGYPGALSTWPARINDQGTIVGSYFVGQPGVQLPENGFIYNKGQWANLNYPNPAAFTHLVGISNAGVVVGNADTDGGFLYANGVFKVISTPNGGGTNVLAISPRLGLILGTGTFSGVNEEGFIATCK